MLPATVRSMLMLRWTGSMTESKPIPLVVRATGPYGDFWLSRSERGLRKLVTRDQADLFPTVEAAELAIKQMPRGYKLARVAFAIELAVDLPSSLSERSGPTVTPPDPHAGDRPA